MNFGYEMGDQWIGTSDVNDFDCVYPWSDIRMCKIAEDGTIIYSDDIEYEQESADVMVEIPCFYVKRTIDNDYEYIWISQTADEGYEIDPAFIKNGKIRDKIYVGAYLSGYSENNKIGSYNDTQPIINLSLNELKQDISEKGNNWSELDLQTLSMLQKLFLVETACKDSQALFMGVVNLSWGTCYAVKDSNNEAVNTIELEDNTSSQKINVGDSVTVFDVPQGESYYCDALFYQKNERNLILTYGLTWDLRQYAGLFGYRANISAEEAKVESGSRLVYR